MWQEETKEMKFQLSSPPPPLCLGGAENNRGQKKRVNLVWRHQMQTVWCRENNKSSTEELQTALMPLVSKAAAGVAPRLDTHFSPMFTLSSLFHQGQVRLCSAAALSSRTCSLSFSPFFLSLSLSLRPLSCLAPSCLETAVTQLLASSCGAAESERHTSNLGRGDSGGRRGARRWGDSTGEQLAPSSPALASWPFSLPCSHGGDAHLQTQPFLAGVWAPGSAHESQWVCKIEKFDCVFMIDGRVPCFHHREPPSSSKDTFVSIRSFREATDDDCLSPEQRQAAFISVNNSFSFIREPRLICEGWWGIRLISLLGILCTNLTLESDLLQLSVNADGQGGLRCEGVCVCVCLSKPRLF